jgi:hypothetical protein
MTSRIPAVRAHRTTDRSGDEREREQHDRPRERSLDAAASCATDLACGCAGQAIAGALCARQASADLARADLPVEERTKRAPLLR